jgi:hypothetical protein
MTTKVTIDAHAGWPVKVEAIDQYPGTEPATSELGIVRPGEVREFNVHSSRKIVVTELAKGA